MLKLIKPTIAMKGELERYVAGFSDVIPGSQFIRDYDDIGDWLVFLKNVAKSDTCPPGLVPALQYVLVDGDNPKILGMVNIRLTLNEYLLKYGGNIGYSVATDERHKGYGTSQLALALDIAKQVGLTKVLLTTNVDNIGSRTVIENNGGVLENIVYDEVESKEVMRYWITID